MNLSLEDIQKLPGNVSEIFSEYPELFESFLRYNKNKINRTGFVFQIQSFNIKYPCFACHIITPTTGKANPQIIEKLKLIKNIAKQQKIYIKWFTFDGDNCYNGLHNLYYGSYINNLVNKLNIKIIKRSKVIRVFSDLLHILKRIRYRLLSNLIHIGFDADLGMLIDINEIRKILHFLPNVDNNRLTKMNDRLPLLLFSPLSLIKLMEKKKQRSSCILVSCSMLDNCND